MLWYSLDGQRTKRTHKRRRWPKFYCSTYCNFAHIVATGHPIEHECIIIPPAALKAEIEQEWDKVISIMEAYRGKRQW